MRVLSEPVNNDHDHLTALRQWQTFDEVRGEVMPRLCRDGQRLQQSGWLDMLVLGVLANGTLVHEFFHSLFEVAPGK